MATEIIEMGRLAKPLENLREALSPLLNTIPKVDYNHDGIISFNEFFFIFKAINKKITESDLEAIFTFFDKNNDGKISFNELEDILKALDVFSNEDDGKIVIMEFEQVFLRLKRNQLSKVSDEIGASISQTEISEAFKVFNYNNAYASFMHLQEAMSPLVNTITKSYSAKLFEVVNNDDDGMISLNEFASIFNAINDKIYERDLENVFPFFDKNGDGKISAEELEQLFKMLKVYSEGDDTIVVIELELVLNSLVHNQNSKRLQVLDSTGKVMKTYDHTVLDMDGIANELPQNRDPKVPKLVKMFFILATQEILSLVAFSAGSTSHSTKFQALLYLIVVGICVLGFLFSLGGIILHIYERKAASIWQKIGCAATILGIIGMAIMFIPENLLWITAPAFAIFFAALAVAFVK